jgi:hypothetical protein
MARLRRWISYLVQTSSDAVDLVGLAADAVDLLLQ